MTAPLSSFCVSNPPSHPLLVIDGECAFCNRWARRLKRFTGIGYAPYQEIAAQFPEIPREQFEHSVQLIEPDRHVFSGAAAAFRMVSAKPALRWVFRLYQHCWPLAWISERLYDIISRYRFKL